MAAKGSKKLCDICNGKRAVFLTSDDMLQVSGLGSKPFHPGWLNERLSRLQKGDRRRIRKALDSLGRRDLALQTLEEP